MSEYTSTDSRSTEATPGQPTAHGAEYDRGRVADEGRVVADHLLDDPRAAVLPEDSDGAHIFHHETRLYYLLVHHAFYLWVVVSESRGGGYIAAAAAAAVAVMI